MFPRLAKHRSVVMRCLVVGEERSGEPRCVRIPFNLSYINRSHRRGNGIAPPAPAPNWTNSVLLLNRCTDEWDLVYSHDFRADQRDCSDEKEKRY